MVSLCASLALYLYPAQTSWRQVRAFIIFLVAYCHDTPHRESMKNDDFRNKNGLPPPYEEGCLNQGGWWGGYATPHKIHVGRPKFSFQCTGIANCAKSGLYDFPSPRSFTSRTWQIKKNIKICSECFLRFCKYLGSQQNYLVNLIASSELRSRAF